MQTRFLATLGSAMALAAPAFAQDSTIYYTTPVLQSGQPVAAETVVRPVPVYTPVPVESVPAGNTATSSDAIPSNEAPSDYLGTPTKQTSQHDSAVSFVSGGIGSFEKSWFDQQQSGYKAKVTYADSTGHHLSGVTVTMTDHAGKTVLSTITEGPYLLIDAKPGSYKLNSSYQGVSKTQTLKLGQGMQRATVVYSAQE